MPHGRKSKNPSPTSPSAFTHDSSTRTGLPAGGTAGKAPVPKAPKKKYWYNPHLSPVLRHDPTGKADRILALVEKAGREPLNAEEKKLLEEALRNHQPWLEWSGKREAPRGIIGQIALSLPRLGTHVQEHVPFLGFVAPSAMPDSAVRSACLFISQSEEKNAILRRPN